MATIASLAVQLSANATGLYAGINAVQARIGSFARNVQGTLSGIPLIGGAVATLPLSMGGMESWLKEGMDRINGMRNAAIQLGVPLKDMGGLALVFGGNMEAASRGLLHMRKTILDAVQTGKGATGVFHTLGVTAEEFAAMGGKQQIDVAFESMRKLGDATQIAAAAFDLFGERRGANFLTMISRGKAGLDAAAEAAERFGHNIDNVDANQVFQASIAMKSIDRAMTGIKMNIAVALAPIISEFAAQFEQVGLNAQFVQEAVTSMAKVIGYGAAYAIDAWRGLETVFVALKSIWFAVVAAMLGGIRRVAADLAKMPDWLGGERFKELSESAGREAMRWAQASGAAAREVNRLNDRASAVSKVQDFFANVADNVARAKAAAAAVVPPVPAVPQGPAEVKLAGAAGFGSQEAYKTLGEFAAGGQTSTLQKLVDQNKRIADLIQKGDLDLAEIRKQLKRGMVREGKI